MKPSEKRRHPRWGAASANFRVRCARTGDEARLIDFSHAGMGLVFATPAALSVGEEVSVLLARDEHSFLRLTVGIATGTRSGEGVRIGGPILAYEALRVGPAAERGEGDLAEIHDPRLAADLLERIAALRPSMVIEIDAATALPARIDDARSRKDALCLIVESAGPLPPVGPTSLSLDLDGGGFAIRGTLIHEGGTRYTLEGPLSITSRARRLTDRVRLSAGRGVMSWSHALVPGQRIVADVEDLSPGGARVRLRASDSSLPPPPGEPVLLHVDGLALPTLASVRHIDAGGDGGVSLGLRFMHESSDDTIRLAREVERIRFPGLQPRQSRARDEVASLLHASGYLDLRETARELSPWHEAADPALSVDSVHAGPDGALDGHLSTTRVYSNTWVFHQLATLQGPLAAQCRRALYLSATGWVSLLSEGKGYAMAYFDRKKRWHAMFFEAFTRWAGSDALAVVAPVDRFEATGDVPDTGAAWDIGEARDEELPRILAAAEQVLPPLLRAATDLREGGLVTSSLCANHVAEGLPRSRSILVAREGNEISAFALCEIGSANLSLFNLLNVAHVVVVPGASDDVQRALLARVRAFYAARGTSHPVIVAMPGTLTGAAAAGLALAETMGCIVMSPEGLKQYRNFLSYSLRAA